MYIGIHKDVSDEIITLHVYCPFWMVNRTGLDLAYQVFIINTLFAIQAKLQLLQVGPSISSLESFRSCLFSQAEDRKDNPPTIHHPSTMESILFSFRGKFFFTKKKALVKVDGKSDWSNKFSLDVAGSSGSVICKSPTQDFEVFT